MDIAAATYVSLTSYKRNGDGVPVAVWIAPLPDGRAGFTTDEGSFKVKRIRNNPAITLRPCDVRGKVADGAEEVAARAVVVTEGADYDATVAAVGKKYGLQFKVLELGAFLKRLVKRHDHRAAVVITLT